MAEENVLAREYNLEINTGDDTTPAWTPIKFITGISPGQTAQRTDDTDFDSGGWEEHSVVMRGKSLSVSLNYKEDPTTGTEDVGQAALIALGEATGNAGKKQFRYYSPGDNGWVFTASADVSWPGGDKVANSSFSAELTMSGAPEAYVPVP